MVGEIWVMLKKYMDYVEKKGYAEKKNICHN